MDNKTVSENKKGAGVLPFSVVEGEVCFLFHRTFPNSKKSGFLIDFGGGVKESEESDVLRAAAREISEETGGLVLVESQRLCEDFSWIAKCESEAELQSTEWVKECTAKMHNLLQAHKKKGKLWEKSVGQYHLLLVEIPAFPVEEVNKVFRAAPKRREMMWVSANDLIEGKTTLPLFPRVAKIEGIRDTFRQIKEVMDQKRE